MKRKISPKQTKCLIIVFMSVLLLVSILLLLNGRKEVDKTEALTSLTDEYNKDQVKDNGLESAEFIVRNEEGNIINSNEIKQDINSNNIDKDKEQEKEKLKKRYEPYIGKVVGFIDTNNYSELYKLLNKEYATDFEVTEGKLKNEYTFKGGVDYEITNIAEESAGIVITTKLIEKSTKNIRVVDFTVFPDNSLADIEISQINSMDKDTTIDDIQYKITKRYEVRLASVYIINIDNRSDQLLDIQDFDIKSRSRTFVGEVLNRSVLQIFPSQNVNLLLKVPNTNYISSLVIKDKLYNGTEKNIEIYDY